MPAKTAGRVLIIDDDEIVLEAMRGLLHASGYEVHCMVSPIGATQVIVTKGIQAVVVDLNMPVMRGDRFISLLRSWERISDLPTILISSSTPEAIEAAASALPGVLVVTKSDMHRSLPQTVDRVFGRLRGSQARPSAASDAAARGASALATPSAKALRLLDDMASGDARSRTELDVVLTSMREQASALDDSPVAQLAQKTAWLFTRCATTNRLTPQARFALRNALSLLSDVRGAPTPQQMAMNNERIELAIEEVRK